MDTNLLETFFVVADTGGLSAAASVLGIPQSVVSRRIKELETLCAAQLLYRHGRGVMVTAAGMALHAATGPLLAQLAQAVDHAAAAELEPGGPVVVAISPMIMSAIGSSLLAEMTRQFPQVRVTLVAASSRYVLERLMQRRIDIAVINDTSLSSQLLSEPLGTARVVFACAAGFDHLPKRSKRDMRFDELEGIPLVVPIRDHWIRRHIDLVAAKGGVNLNIVYEVEGIEITKELVASGKVGALLPRLGIVRELASGQFVERRIRSPDIAARSILATASNRPVTATMKATIVVLKKVAAKAYADNA